MISPRVALAWGLAAAAGLGGLHALRAGGPASATPLPSPAEPEVVEASITFFEARLARDPDNTLFAGQLINRYVLRFGQAADLADVARAEALARRAAELSRDPARALARLSGILLMQHRFAEAFDQAEAAFRRDPGSAETAGALLEAALAAGRYAVADTLAGRLDPRTLEGRVRRALYLHATGASRAGFELLDSACDELRRTGASPAVTAWCLTQLADLDHGLRGPDEARATLKAALRLQPGYRGAVEGLADLALAEGDARSAAAGYRRILSDAHPDLYLRLAEALRELGDSGEARRMEDRFLAVAGQPAREPLFGHPLALHLAERARDEADLDRALAIAKREVARRPTMESYDLLCLVHFHRGELAAALQASDAARTWGVPTPTMQWHRGQLLRARGLEAEAIPLLEEAASTPTLLAPHVRVELRRSGVSAPAPPTARPDASGRARAA